MSDKENYQKNINKSMWMKSAQEYVNMCSSKGRGSVPKVNIKQYISSIE